MLHVVQRDRSKLYTHILRGAWPHKPILKRLVAFLCAYSFPVTFVLLMLVQYLDLYAVLKWVLCTVTQP